MTFPKTRRIFRGMLPIAMILACGLTMAEVAWVQGSWVNLRSSASPTASVKGQLTTNMQVQVTAREGEWCAVRVVSSVSEGYVHCSLPMYAAQMADFAHCCHTGATPIASSEVGLTAMTIVENAYRSAGWTTS